MSAGAVTSGPATVQYRVVLGKKDEVVVGPDGADVVITIAKEDCSLDPNVAYMQGRLKAAGHTGVLFDVLRSGAAAEVLRAHA
ncbi:MAG TPA: hypothetical protein VFP08_02435 [Acidimicrobiales bacterium]|nr:hypothetical protein [Acidimicrobiales bacterium]